MGELFRPGEARGREYRKNQAKSNTTASELFGKVCQISRNQFTNPSIVQSENVGCFPIPPDKAPSDAFFDLGRSLIPDNIAQAFVDFNILGLIFFIMLYAFY